VTQLYIYVKNRLAEHTDGERGATAVEYGLMVALIAAFVAASVALLGVDVKGAFDDAVAAIP
jgi:pilus assembly protein Flp/PilA